MPSRNKTPPPLEENRLYKIGEVSRIVGVESFVLRFWEKEFPEVRPVKAESRHRLYDRKVIETLRRIRELLHVEKYTIEGARRRMKLDEQVASENKARGKQLDLGLGAATEADSALWERLEAAEALLKELSHALGRLRSQPSTPSEPQRDPEVGE